MKMNVFIPTTLSDNGYTTHSVIFRGVWENIIKMHLRKLGCENVVCISLGQERVR